MTLDIKDRLYTSSEVAEILGVSLRSVYRYLEEGKLDADIKTATGRHRFSKKNIMDFLQPSESVQKNNSSEARVVDPNSKISQTDVKPSSTSFTTPDTIEDEFDFDKFFETEVVKRVDTDSKDPYMSPIDTEGSNPNSNNVLSSSKSDFLDDNEDLEKLFEELEREFASNSVQAPSTSNKQVSKLADDDFDFDFDFLDESENLEDYLNSTKEAGKETKSNSYEPGNVVNPLPVTEEKKKDSEDFDFDFLDSFFEEEKDGQRKEVSNSGLMVETNSKDKKMEVKDEEDSDFFNLDSIFSDLIEEERDTKINQPIKEDKSDDSDSWLERFRKASEKSSEVSTSKVSKEEEDFDISSFFKEKNTTSSIVPKEKVDPVSEAKTYEDEFKLSREARKKEYYYISSLSGPKEIAQTIDKVSRKFDLDYAFTLNAGLSLHKDISPFTLINVYINERDLEIFEDYLKLTPSSERDAHICLMLARDREIFEDSYELNGLFVVSNVQLRSDFIDKGMDNYAREV